MKIKIHTLTKKTTFWLGILAVGLLVGVSLQLVRAWTEPTQAPPGGNVGAPLNTSDIGQAKGGGLLLNTRGADNGLIVQNGNVGIGTATPNSGKTNIIDVKDAWIRDANSGAGAWASSLGGSGGGSNGTFRPYVYISKGGFTTSAIVNSCPPGDTEVAYRTVPESCASNTGSGTTGNHDWSTTKLPVEGFCWVGDGGQECCRATAYTLCNP